MKKSIKISYTEQEFRQIIREELRAVLNNEDVQISGPADEGFISLDQATEFLKLKKSSIYNRVHNGTIPFHKAGKRLLFKKSELAEWIKK